jgi:predicted phosphodiesterase
MKLQVVSDLHIEMKPFTLKVNPAADVLVLVGDIVVFKNGCVKLPQLENIIRNVNIPVVYVMGNHEHYGFGDIAFNHKVVKTLEKKFPHFHFLENESWEYQDVEFIGSTLWSDFDLSPNRLWFSTAVQTAISDFTVIVGMTGQKMMELNKAARSFIDHAVRKKNNLKKVVVTHFVPTEQSIAEIYKGNSLNPYFVCNCEQLMPGVHTWIHGHTHSSFDYMLTKVHPSGHVLVDTHIVCNPRGYADENRNGFDSQKIVEV